MAEALAQNWGNLQFGIRELEQRDGESTVEAFAWDLETNTRQCKVFQVQHIRAKGEYVDGKKTGRTINTKLTDPRDIYEMVANNGARRVRACILGVIPGDVIEAAMKQCETTLHAKAEVTPERIKGLLEKFAAYKVTKAQIEGRIQRRIESMTAGQLVSLGKVYNSLKDGVSTVSDWFETEQQTKTARRGASPLAAVVVPTDTANAQDGAAAAAEPATDDLSDLPL
jgi:hypothetical protein